MGRISARTVVFNSGTDVKREERVLRAEKRPAFRGNLARIASVKTNACLFEIG